MANQQTENQTIINNIVDELRLNPVNDIIPKKVMPTISPVFEVNAKRCDVVRGINRTTTGGSTIFTTPTDKDFYLVGCQFGLIKDATCDMASGTVAGISAVLEAQTRNIIQTPTITLTAQEVTQGLSFPVPIKIDRGTTILIISNAFTAGVCIRTASIIGYTQENNNQFSTG